MPEDRNKPPPGYEAIRDWTWESTIILDKCQTYEEAIAACWAHRDGIAKEEYEKRCRFWHAVFGPQWDPGDDLDMFEKLAKRDREQQAKALEDAAAAMLGDSVEVDQERRLLVKPAFWLRDRAEEIRRGDA